MFPVTQSQKDRVLEYHQDPIFAADGLFCEEESFDDDWVGGSCLENLSFVETNVENPSTFMESDLFWEDDELLTLLSKEKEIHLGPGYLELDESIFLARNEAVGWMLRVIGHYGFKALTAVLAVNYFDRFMSGVCFQRDKPWMSQLAAVACLSIAAKVEEIQVPLLLDLQVQESKFLFEAKAIQRMELLVLSTLQWRMNLVTPLSFIDHIIRRFKLMTNLHWEFLGRCEILILSIIADPKLLQYPPSVIATATMLIVIKEIEPLNVPEYKNEFVSLLQISKENVDECYDLIVELTGGHHQTNKHCQHLKRKYEANPGSPNGVIDAYICGDSSNESWSVSFPAQPLCKRNRVQGLAPVSVGNNTPL